MAVCVIVVRPRCVSANNVIKYLNIIHVFDLGRHLDGLDACSGSLALFCCCLLWLTKAQCFNNLSLSLSVSLSRYHSTQLLKHLSSIDWRDYDARTCLCMSDVLFISRMFATRQRSEEFCKSCKSLFTILMVAQQQ